MRGTGNLTHGDTICQLISLGIKTSTLNSGTFSIRYMDLETLPIYGLGDTFCQLIIRLRRKSSRTFSITWASGTFIPWTWGHILSVDKVKNKGIWNLLNYMDLGNIQSMDLGNIPVHGHGEHPVHGLGEHPSPWTWGTSSPWTWGTSQSMDLGNIQSMDLGTHSVS